MLTIRKVQFDAFKKVAIERFVDETALDLTRILPKHCEALGEQGVREAIHLGIERATVYGIVDQPDVAGYVRLMFMFGVDFDKKQPWAREALNPPPAATEQTVMQRLANGAEEFLRNAIKRGALWSQTSPR